MLSARLFMAMFALALAFGFLMGLIAGVPGPNYCGQRATQSKASPNDPHL